jgi:peptidoglycan/LPS O-acetylase OafA/YrhL
MTTSPVRATGHAGRTYGIDLLRGVACLSVLLFHYLSRGPRAGYMQDALWPSVEVVARYGYLGVHLFFMVSGYVIFMSAVGRTPRAFVASRVARLYPAFWVACVLTMTAIVVAGDDRFRISWTDFAWNLTLVPQYVGAAFVDGAYWSLAVELQFYLLVWCVLRADLMRRVEVILWLWLALALLDALRPVYPAERWLIAHWAPLFVLGAVTYQVAANGWSVARGAMLAASLLLGIWHARIETGRLSTIWEGAGPDAAIVSAVLATAAAVFVLIGIGAVRVRQTRLATLPGRLTYPVYLVHQVAGYLLYAQLNRHLQQPLLAVVLTVLAAIGTGAALNLWVERPIAPALRRWVAGTRTASAAPARIEDTGSAIAPRHPSADVP